MRSYPIWNKIQACIYKSSKSFGAKDTSQCEIMVGSSKNNSHLLGRIITKRIETEDSIKFTLSVNDVIIRKMIFENNNGKAGELLIERGYFDKELLKTANHDH